MRGYPLPLLSPFACCTAPCAMRRRRRSDEAANALIRTIIVPSPSAPMTNAFVLMMLVDSPGA